MRYLQKNKKLIIIALFFLTIMKIGVSHVVFADVPTPVPTQVITDPILLMFINCYDINISSPQCTDAQEVDFNHDGSIDGTDYNLYLLYKLHPSLTITLPSPSIATATGTFTSSITSAPTEMDNILLTLTPTVLPSSPTSLTPEVTQARQPIASVTPTSVSVISAFTNGGVFIKLFGLVGIGILGVSLIYISRRVFKKSKLSPVEPQPVQQKISAQPVSTAVVPDEPIDTTYFVSVLQPDPNGKGIWVQLTGDAGSIEGLYHAHAVPQGFSRIKGTKKTEKGKTYIDITEILPA